MLESIHTNWNRQTFWKMAAVEQISVEFLASYDLQRLQIAQPETLRRIFIQYRFFTIFYISDLALLISRLPFCTLRSSLAEFLNDELGKGTSTLSHPHLYDSFLKSIGVMEYELNQPLQMNLELLQKVQNVLVHDSVASAIGLRGMGGECLCQIYLSAMHEHFTKNPYIQSIRHQIDWRFWDIHTGEEDIHHREVTRSAIDEYLVLNPQAIDDLANGYLYSKGAWNKFWSNIFKNVKGELPC